MTDRITAHHQSVLSQLARAIDEPLETFFGDPPEGDVGELFTLVQLWLAIEDKQARRRVLKVAQVESERAGCREGVPCVELGST
ncbi:hypothetical protein [Methylobacterium trifolii]|uniref:hypothetical protein n=1 Tax=Methylobacterium trifolii TaxID=1003092 RepID=UPI001EDCE82F|nr:hypothetical protein [Methylobacterium trifolii]